MRRTQCLAAGLKLVVLIGALASAPLTALAQEAIPTATRGADGGAPTIGWPDTAEAPMRLSDHVDGGPGFLRPTGPCGGPRYTASGKLDKSAHGEVWAGVGTHGYREIGAATCLPIGDNSAVTIAVDVGHIGGRR